MANGTIHFEALWKNGIFGKTKTGLCSKFAMRRPRTSNALTTDTSKVSCTRCAKSLGVTPAVKEESGSPSGTCQCCFGIYKVPRFPKTKNISLHGYERPGNGYIIGRCRGEGCLPYELSCERTRVFCAELVMRVSGLRAYLKQLQDGDIASLPAEIDKTTIVQVKLGEGEKQNPFRPEHPWMKVPSYEKLQKLALANVEGEIRALTAEIEFLAGKIENWKVVEFPVKKG